MAKINLDIVRANDILQSIEHIENLNLKRNSTDNDIFAAAYLVCVMGEAANNISLQTQAKYPKIYWRGIIGTRNKIIHEYSKLDKNILFGIVENELPKLGTVLEGFTKCVQAKI